jgi:hypothetical protein
MDREHRVWTGAPVISSYPKVGSHSPSNKHAETRQRPPGRQAARPSRICLGVPGQTNRDASSSSEPRISELYIWARTALRSRSRRMPALSKPRVCTRPPQSSSRRRGSARADLGGRVRAPRRQPLAQALSTDSSANPEPLALLATRSKPPDVGSRHDPGAGWWSASIVVTIRWGLAAHHGVRLAEPMGEDPWPSQPTRTGRSALSMRSYSPGK